MIKMVFFSVDGQKYARQSVYSCLFCFLFVLFYKKILCMYDGWLTRRYCFSNWEGLGLGTWLGLGILLTISHTSVYLTVYFWLSHGILLTISRYTSDYLTVYFWPSHILLTISQYTSDYLTVYFWLSHSILLTIWHTSNRLRKKIPLRRLWMRGWCDLHVSCQ